MFDPLEAFEIESQDYLSDKFRFSRCLELSRSDSELREAWPRKQLVDGNKQFEWCPVHDKLLSVQV
jgi:hypothetical protein